MVRGLGMVLVLTGAGLLADRPSHEGAPKRWALALLLCLAGAGLLTEGQQTGHP